MKRGFFIFLGMLAIPATIMAGVTTPAVASPTATIDAIDQACRTIPADFSTPPARAAKVPASLWNGWHYGPSVSLTAVPSTVLVDRPIAIRLKGLKPGEPITVQARMTGAQGIDWHSTATFIANHEGVVDVAHMAPRYGDYSGIHAMGLVWSMQPEKVKKPSAAAFYMPRGGAELYLTATANGHTLATAKVMRLPHSPHVKERKIDSDGLVGNLYMPAGAGPHPAVIVIGGSEGGPHPQIEEAALLASHGYVALGLAYFQGAVGQHNPRLAKLPKELVKIPLEYFRKAADWLLKQPGVAGRRIGIIGWSKGAEATLLLASTYPKTFSAAVAFAPSSQVWSGIHRGPGPLHSSWTLHGKQIPFASYVPQPDIFNAKKKTIDLRDGYLKPILKGKYPAAATIRVGRIAGPVLLISGTDDKIWPSGFFAARIMARLKRHHHPYADESLCYRGAGHYLLWPYRPTITTAFAAGPVSLLAGGSQTAYAYADSDFWPKLLAFLHHALNPKQ